VIPFLLHNTEERDSKRLCCAGERDNSLTSNRFFVEDAENAFYGRALLNKNINSSTSMSEFCSFVRIQKPVVTANFLVLFGREAADRFVGCFRSSRQTCYVKYNIILSAASWQIRTTELVRVSKLVCSIAKCPIFTIFVKHC
jgi:hypothetical protein